VLPAGINRVVAPLTCGSVKIDIIDMIEHIGNGKCGLGEIYCNEICAICALVSVQCLKNLLVCRMGRAISAVRRFAFYKIFLLLLLFLAVLA